MPRYLQFWERDISHIQIYTTLPKTNSKMFLKIGPNAPPPKKNGLPTIHFSGAFAVSCLGLSSPLRVLGSSINLPNTTHPSLICRLVARTRGTPFGFHKKTTRLAIGELRKSEFSVSVSVMDVFISVSRSPREKLPPGSLTASFSLKIYRAQKERIVFQP